MNYRSAYHELVEQIERLEKERSMIFDIQTTTKEELFIKAYFEALDFTETGDVGQPEHGADLEVYYQREQVIDCLSFYQRIACYISDEQIEDAGRDFWFTRNGHGVGFWDGDWTLHGEMFTKRAEGYGETDAYFENPEVIQEEEG